MPAYGKGWTALDLCVCYRGSYAEHCANSDIHPHQPLHLYKILLKSGKICIHREPHVRDWKDCWLKVFWVHVWENRWVMPCSGEAMPRSAHTQVPSRPVSSHIVVTSPCHSTGNAPHPSPGTPEGPDDLKSSLAEGPRKGRWYLTEARGKHALGISLSWTLLEPGGVAILVLFYIFSVFLSSPFCF